MAIAVADAFGGLHPQPLVSPLSLTSLSHSPPLAHGLISPRSPPPLAHPLPFTSLTPFPFPPPCPPSPWAQIPLEELLDDLEALQLAQEGEQGDEDMDEDMDDG